jgi:hypothetical protein
MASRTNDARKSSQHRDRCQLTLHVFLVVTSSIAILSVILIWRWQARAQAIAFIQEHGGTIRLARAYSDSTSVFPDNGAPLRESIFDFFWPQPVEVISFNGAKINDSEFAELAKHRRALSAVKQIDISCTDLTDKSLAEMDKFACLELVSIRYTKTTDDGLAILADITKIQLIGISRQHITPRGLDHMARMKSLRVVMLDCTTWPLSDVIIRSLPNVSIVN